MIGEKFRDLTITLLLVLLVFGTLTLGGIMVIELAHQASRTQEVLDRVEEVSCQNARNNRAQLIAVRDIERKLGIPAGFSVPS
jgi:hypothetical protein